MGKSFPSPDYLRPLLLRKDNNDDFEKYTCYLIVSMLPVHDQIPDMLHYAIFL